MKHGFKANNFASPQGWTLPSLPQSRGGHGLAALSCPYRLCVHPVSAKEHCCKPLDHDPYFYTSTGHRLSDFRPISESVDILLPCIIFSLENAKLDNHDCGVRRA